MSIRKITPILVAFLVSIGLISFAVTKDKWISANTNTKKNLESGETRGIQLAVQKAIETVAEKDSDGDGIKDWEETFQKSIEANKTEKKSDTTSNVESNDPKTKTDEISRALFSEYMELKQSGKLNESSMSNLVNKAVSQVSVGKVSSYSATDIKTIPDTDISGAKNYANALVNIREKYKEEYRANQIIIVGNTVDFDDQASVESIHSTAKLYESITKEMAVLLVPKSLVASHVALLNNYATSAIGLEQFANLKIDPILGLVGIQKHSVASTEESELLAGIARFYTNRGIVFSVDEPGSRIGNI